MNEDKILQPLEVDVPSLPDHNSRRLIAMVWVFVTIIVFTLGLAFYSLTVLSAARAYVGGEGLWSKAQKDMAYMLARYTRSHEEVAYQAYLNALQVILGDRQARLALDDAHFDYKLAHDGFVRGGNHPDDIDGMIQLFHYFHAVPDIKKAMEIWTNADQALDDLVELGQRLHAASMPALGESDTVQYLNKIYMIDLRLRPLEDEFSYRLGVASRKAQTFLMSVIIVIIASLLTLACVFSHRLVRQSESTQLILRSRERQFRELLQFAPLSMIIFRLSDAAILYANDHTLRKFNLTDAMIKDRSAGDFFIDQEVFYRLVRKLRTHENIHSVEMQLRGAIESPCWALMSAQQISYQSQQCAYATFVDITDSKRLQEELQHRAFHDILTGLPNRAMFVDKLHQLIIASATREPRRFAILFVDVDRFKIINDELGHDVGDQLLQGVAERLRSSVRQDDFVSRLGGDEFVVLIDQDTGIDRLVEAAKSILQAIAMDYSVNTHCVNVTCSIGISCYPDDGADSTTLMKTADIAMYRAKELGKNNYQIYGNPHFGNIS